MLFARIWRTAVSRHSTAMSSMPPKEAFTLLSSLYCRRPTVTEDAQSNRHNLFASMSAAAMAVPQDSSPWRTWTTAFLHQATSGRRSVVPFFVMW